MKKNLNKFWYITNLKNILNHLNKDKFDISDLNYLLIKEIIDFDDDYYYLYKYIVDFKYISYSSKKNSESEYLYFYYKKDLLNIIEKELKKILEE